MTTPPPLPSVSVTATFQDASGAALAGHVVFTAGARLRFAAGGVVVPDEPVVAALDTAGKLSVALVPTDDPAIEPRQWDYRVEERIGTAGEAAALSEGERLDVSKSYSLKVPTGDGTLDLADIAP